MTIQHAIDKITDANASRPYEIHVASGTYTGEADYVVSMHPHVDLRGGYEQTFWSRDITSNTTVIDGQNARPCVEMASDTTLDGFFVTQGSEGVITSYNIQSATISNSIIIRNKGYGVLCDDISNPTIINCVIAENKSGGVYCSYYCKSSLTNCFITHNNGCGVSCAGSSLTLTKCTITSNISLYNGGGISYDSTHTSGGLIMIDCEITGNRGYSGGGVYCCGCSPTITNCNISHNIVSGYYNYHYNMVSGGEGGGIYCSGQDCSPKLTNCIISKNQALGCYDNYSMRWIGRGGGGIYCSGPHYSPKLINCIVAGNSATFGGGLFCTYSCSPVLMNCTIVDNTEGTIDYDSSSKLTNCILWNHGREVIEGASTTITNSCVQGGCIGENNINAPPQFVDPESLNFHLDNGSPCINRGASLNAPVTDIEGNARPLGDGVDIGA